METNSSIELSVNAQREKGKERGVAIYPGCRETKYGDRNTAKTGRESEREREREPAISAAAAATTYTEALSLLEKVGKLLLLLLERKNLAREKTEEDEANYDYH